MNRTHLRRPSSRVSLFQWSVADRTVAACGTGLIGEQPPPGLPLTARIADNSGRFPEHHVAAVSVTEFSRISLHFLPTDIPFPVPIV